MFAYEKMKNDSANINESTTKEWSMDLCVRGCVRMDVCRSWEIKVIEAQAEDNIKRLTLMKRVYKSSKRERERERD